YAGKAIAAFPWPGEGVRPELSDLTWVRGPFGSSRHGRQSGSACQGEPAAVDLVPVQEMDELVDILLLAVLVVHVKGVLVHVAYHERLAEPEDANFVQIAGNVVKLAVDHIPC